MPSAGSETADVEGLRSAFKGFGLPSSCSDFERLFAAGRKAKIPVTQAVYDRLQDTDPAVCELLCISTSIIAVEFGLLVLGKFVSEIRSEMTVAHIIWRFLDTIFMELGRTDTVHPFAYSLWENKAVPADFTSSTPLEPDVRPDKIVSLLLIICGLLFLFLSNSRVCLT